MEKHVQEMLDRLVGKLCWRKQVGNDRSLSLGFGERVNHKATLTDRMYGEWEVGTYRCAWRIAKNGKVLCASQDAVDNIGELNNALSRIELGRFVALRHLTALDVQLECDNGITVDFLTTISDDDECFHIFCPGKQIVVFSPIDGWKVGPSDKPWP